MDKSKWQNWVSLVVGFWVFLVPGFVDSDVTTVSGSNVVWNFWIVGGVVVCISALALLNDLKPWEEWTNLFAGLWLILSPWLLGFAYETSLIINALISGVLITLVSLIALPEARKVKQQRVSIK